MPFFGVIALNGAFGATGIPMVGDIFPVEIIATRVA